MLQRKLAEVQGADFKVQESPISLTLVHMLRKLGPTVEMENILQMAFRSCIRLLRDDIAFNDFQSFRHLTMVLSCLHGFETEAQIASTAQLYIIDNDIIEKELKEGRESITAPDEDPDPSANDAPRSQAENQENDQEDQEVHEEKDTELLIGTKGKDEPDSQEDSNEEAQIETMNFEENESGREVGNEAENVPVPEEGQEAREEKDIKDSEMEEEPEEGKSQEAEIDPIAEGLGDDHYIVCDMCDRGIYSWKDDSVYRCIYCINCDICGDCFEKRATANSELVTPKDDVGWRTVCPQGHRHVKAPVEGWKGVNLKEGKLRIGDEEVSFNEWLISLEDKWKK